MKTALIIGPLDKATREIADALLPICHPQLCPNDETTMRDMLRLLTPDILILPLPDSGDEAEDILFHLDQESLRPPIIAIGSVDVQSALIRKRWLPGKRITFLQRPTRPAEVVASVKGFVNESAKPAQPAVKKILIVDDDPSVLRLLHKMLSSRWAVSVVTSGPRALIAISKSKPDLILMDYVMPLVDGRLTLEILRSEKGTRDIPVVFLTGLSDPAHVEEVLALQPQGYLLKPPSEEVIFAKIASIFGEDVAS